jgi:hypothetical protein
MEVDRIPDYRNCYPTEGPLEIHVMNMDLRGNPKLGYSTGFRPRTLGNRMRWCWLQRSNLLYRLSRVSQLLSAHVRFSLKVLGDLPAVRGLDPEMVSVARSTRTPVLKVEDAYPRGGALQTSSDDQS